MPTSTSITIVGLDEINRLFAAFPAAAGRIFQQYGTVFAKTVYDRAYKIVPVKTGRLRSSIGTSANATEIRFFATAPYAAAVHDGARGRPGRPFLMTPVNENVDKFVEDFGNGIMNYFRTG